VPVWQELSLSEHMGQDAHSFDQHVPHRRCIHTESAHLKTGIGNYCGTVWYHSWLIRCPSVSPTESRPFTSINRSSPVPMDNGLADVLARWREIAPYKQDGDYIFGSPNKNGTQPYWPNAAMEDHIRPAALRAGIQKRIGWHTFRHSFGTLVNSEGADVATTQALMRHANVSITLDKYVQAVTPAKREAQSRLVQAIPFPNVPTRLTETAATA
jgi:Phage integrase family